MSESLVVEAKGILRKTLFENAIPMEFRPDLVTSQCELHTLLKRTVDCGESNSILIIGKKGSGKSSLIRSTLQRLNSIQKSFMVVHLNGFLQTDDRLALDEITRQLHLENTIAEKVFGSFSETLSFLLRALRGGSSTISQPVIFVLEEFDLFANHKKQSLLYNLFDIAQAGLTPIAVVGLTCCADVTELLEKRVKSRFSHRQIFICNSWTFEDFVVAFAAILKLPLNGKKHSSKWKTFLNKWNAHIDDLAKNISVLEILRNLFHHNNEITGLQQLLTWPISLLSLEHPFIAPADIADSARMIFADPTMNVLLGVSVLELCLLIAMSHLTSIYDGEPFNFQMVYNEFLKFSRKKSHVLQNYPKSVVLKAFENLVELELLETTDNSHISSAKTQKEYRPMRLLLTQSQLKEAVDKFSGCPTDVKKWAESSIV